MRSSASLLALLSVPRHNLKFRSGASYREGWGVYGGPIRIFDTNFFTVNFTSIKRGIVLLLKEQYDDKVRQTMLFANIS